MITGLKKYKRAALAALSAAFAVLGVTLVIYFIIYPSGAQFHSDCTDTIFWANASRESGKLFNSDFGYAALLPFGGSLLMLPFFGAFGVSMATQTIGMVLFALLFFAGVYFVCRSIGFEVRRSLAAIGFMAFTFSISEKLREIFWCHVIYYSLGALFIFALLGLVLRAYNSHSSKVSLLYTAAACVLASLIATDGVQLIVSSVIPVVLAVVAEKILDGEHKLDKKNCIRPLIIVAALAGASVLGLMIIYAIQNGISAGYENAYSSYSATQDWINNLTVIPSHWFTLLGVDIEKNDKMFTLQSILQLVKLCFAGLLAIIPIVSLFNYKKFDRNGKILLLTHWALTAVIIFAVVFGSLSGANWRLSPIIATSLLVCLCSFRTAFISVDARVLKRLCALSLAAFIAACMLSAGKVLTMPKDGKAVNPNYQLGVYLKNEGLEYGYSSFWNSQSTTLLTDSAVKVRSITVTEDGISPYYYQSSKSWFTDAESNEYFIALNSYEVSLLSSNLILDDIKQAADSIKLFDDFTILVYSENPFAASTLIPEKSQ